MRYFALTTALLALLVAGCSEGPSGSGGGEAASSGESAAPKGGKVVKVALPTAQTSFANADIAVAQAKGYFKQQGVGVELQNFGSGLKVVQAVVAGGADVGASSIEPVVAAASRGQPLPIIGSYTDRLAVTMVTPKAVANPDQLRGKRLGIQDVGAFREVMTRLVLQGAGMTPDDVSYRPVESNGYTGALLAGQIQSAILQQEQAIDAMQRDDGLHVLADLYKTDPRYFYGTYFTKEGWLKANGDTAERFLAAITQAHRFMYDNREETVRIVAKATGFKPEVIDKAYAHLLVKNAVFPVNDGLDEGRLTHTLQRMKKLGLLQGAAPQASEIVDRAPIDAAVKRIGGPADEPDAR
jgi:ABC-type nitrate/sulfonate/bicarbonate transport system substrate-binding protein